MRLVKYLAHSGVASRRAAELLIAAGRVGVNGLIIEDPALEVTESDRITFDGELVRPEPRVVYALNKPAGVLSTASDTHGRPTVTSMVPTERRLYPVGRLDADSTGLILLTNDGELANLITHPRHGMAKRYQVKISGPRISERALQQLRTGVRLKDGITAPAQVRRLGPHKLEVTIHEGRKHQVRRMCEAVGHPVLALERVGIGELTLGSLRPGRYRRLSGPEIERLYRLAAKKTRS